MTRTFLAFSAAIAAFCSVPAACAPPLRPKIVGVANIAFKVHDAEAARAFYSEILGYPQTYYKQAWLNTGDDRFWSWFRVNPHQYIEVETPLANPKEDKLIHIAFETTDARGMRDYLRNKRVDVTLGKIGPGEDGSFRFTVRDPDGHSVEFVQYLPEWLTNQGPGRPSTVSSVSNHILHVGIFVKDRAKADAFYKDILGFRPMWEGNIESPSHPVALLVPDGGDWLEYTLLKKGNKLKTEQLGAINHVCLEVKDIQAPYKTVIERGYKPLHEPSIGTSGHWLANLFDPDGSRVELMVRKVARTPCCTPLFDPYMEIDPPSKHD